jgi:hypothetical protein
LRAEVVWKQVEEVWSCPAEREGPMPVAIYVCAFFVDGERYVGFFETMS